MKRMTNAKRFLALLMAAVMVLGMIPAIVPVEAEAATTAAAEYITLPITIRDYANDGMLFEFNELGDGSAVASSSNPSMAHTKALFNPTYRILNGGTDWTVANGTANGATAATGTLNGYQTFTTNSETDALTLTYTLPTGAGQELQYKNRVSDLGYIVLTFQSSTGAVPGSITLTDVNGATYTASYTGVQGAGAADSNDTGFVRAYYKVDDAAAESAVITSVTINTDQVNGQQVVTNPGEVDYVYSLVTGAYTDMAQYYVVDPTSGFALTNVNNTSVSGTPVTVEANRIISDEALPSFWSFNGQLFFTLPGDGNAYALAANRQNVLSLTTSWIQGDATCNWTISNKGNGEYTLVRNNRYLYCSENGTFGMSSTERRLRLYTPNGTTPEAPEYGEGSGPATFSVMEVEFFNELDAAPAQLRCMGTDGSAVTDANGNRIVLFWSQLGNTHANNTYTLWTTVGNNKNYGFLQSDIITSSDPQTTGTNKDDDADNVNSNRMDDYMPGAVYYSPSGEVTITLSNGVQHVISGSMMRSGLVQNNLGTNKQLVYAEDTVYYLAFVLNETLAYKAFAADYNGVERRNFSYVLGTKVINNGEMDLATAIRKQLGPDPAAWSMGTYAEAKAKFEGGNLNSYTQIKTVYDAAYFLLHNIYSDNEGYGQTIPKYTELQLSKVEETNGVAKYVFDSGYTTNYDGGVISNPDQNASGKEFDPVQNEGYGITGSPYIDLVGDSNKAKFDSYNFNMTLEGHAQFIYYYDDNLYFRFTGDDDVYLFINDKLVLDLGAVHGDSNGKVYLNKVANLCGLEDGEAYDFDFYYMERHGHAAHFSIETNIKIVDPAMLTQKTGYQNGVEVGYNGYVDPAKPVNYAFQLTNKGESILTNLEFLDEDIGVSLTPSEISLNPDTIAAGGVSNLLVAVYNADGSIKEYVAKGSLTEAKLKELLTTGLAVGERILIHGFAFDISGNNAWTDDTYFHNTVQTTATAPGENTTTADDKTLYGVASYRVQKPVYTFDNDHFYTVGQLASGDDKVNLKENSVLTITEEELLALVKTGTTADGTKVSATSYDSIKICSASGNTEANYNTKAAVNGKEIVYTTPVTGTDVFYFKAMSGNVTYGPIRVNVYNYGWANNVYVLDYSLPVELNGTQFGLSKNDELNVDNPYVVSTEITTANATSNYGTFALTTEESAVETCYNGQSLKYTMNKFMDNIDSIEVTITIKESGVATPDNRTNGVTFTQKIEVAPASVVYYEDDFAGITYVNSGKDSTGNVWAEYVANGHTGREEQSADQDSNYGSDPNYSDDTKWGTLTLDEEKLKSDIMSYMDYAGKAWDYLKNADIIPPLVAEKIEAAYAKYMKELEGTASNGTIHELILSPGTSATEIMYFDFQGTGFELISRATQDLYAVLSVEVYELNTDGTISKGTNGYYEAGDYNGDGTETEDFVPVITESEGGDVYEVPIIKIDNLPYSKYRVAVYASNSSAANREIYVDGIRIYEPLGAEKDAGDNYLEDTYYSADEANAEFYEIRPLILGIDTELGTQIALTSATGTNVSVGAGTTLVEDVKNDNGESTFQVQTDTEKYLTSGPNNEVYLAAAETNSAQLLTFYIQQSALEEGMERSIQIGAHRKIDTNGVIDATTGETVVEDGAVYLIYGSSAEQIASGTDNIVAIGSGTEQYITIDASKLVFTDGVAKVMVGTIGGENAGSNILALTNLKLSGYEFADNVATQMTSLEETQDPLSSDLMVTGYSLRSMLAAPAEDDSTTEETTPDETVPETTVPEETVPETTVPEETVPETTVPEETVPETTKPVQSDSVSVQSAYFLSGSVRSGSRNTLTVEVKGKAESIVILDNEGNEVDHRVVSVVSTDQKQSIVDFIGGIFGKIFGKEIYTPTVDSETYTIILTAEGTRGETVTYTIYALDSDGNQTNQVTASFKIR